MGFPAIPGLLGRGSELKARGGQNRTGLPAWPVGGAVGPRRAVPGLGPQLSPPRPQPSLRAPIYPLLLGSYGQGPLGLTLGHWAPRDMKWKSSCPGCGQLAMRHLPSDTTVIPGWLQIARRWPGEGVGSACQTLIRGAWPHTGGPEGLCLKLTSLGTIRPQTRVSCPLPTWLLQHWAPGNAGDTPRL